MLGVSAIDILPRNIKIKMAYKLPFKNPMVLRGQKESADDLLVYKELLDSGIISQDEFDAKKKQILGL